MAPIIMFVYNKPDTTLETLQMLEKNIGAEETDLYIYSDGPKLNQADDASFQNVTKVREIIKKKYNFKSCKVFEAASNMGLAKSVIGGVTATLQWSETAIIIEDDVLTSRHFIEYMNTQLAQYMNEEKVFSIGSWNYYNPTESSFFLRVPDSIAWGVFRRSWKNFEPDSTKLISEIEARNKAAEFDFDGAYGFLKMLHDQNNKKVDSWAIRWYASCFLNNGLCLYPSVSLTKHIGNVKGAAHLIHSEDIYRQTFDVTNQCPNSKAVEIKESAAAVKAYKQFHQIPDKTTISIMSKIKALFSI
jgi:hypothetical protein